MKQGIDRPFVFIEGKKRVWTVTLVVWLVVAIGIIFTCVEPLFTGDYATSFWTAVGPVPLELLLGYIIHIKKEKALL